jgi:hypothetical protein
MAQAVVKRPAIVFGQVILGMRLCVFIVFDLLELLADGSCSLTRRLFIKAARMGENWFLVALMLKDASDRGAHPFGPERLPSCSGISWFLDERKDR